MLHLLIPHVEAISSMEDSGEGGEYGFESIEELIEDLNAPYWMNCSISARLSTGTEK